MIVLFQKLLHLLKKYDGIILTGSTLRINDFSNEIRKAYRFCENMF